MSECSFIFHGNKFNKYIRHLARVWFSLALVFCNSFFLGFLCICGLVEFVFWVWFFLVLRKFINALASQTDHFWSITPVVHFWICDKYWTDNIFFEHVISIYWANNIVKIISWLQERVSCFWNILQFFYSALNSAQISIIHSIMDHGVTIWCVMDQCLISA